MPRHAYEAALTDDEFETLLVATGELNPVMQLRGRFALIAMGRLGLRAGELAHLTGEWVNWSRKQIEIPSFERCTNGLGGSVCSFCKDSARGKAEVRDVEVEELLVDQWEPKTEAAVRSIPFGWDRTVESEVSSFFMRLDGWPTAYQSLRRTVEVLAELGGHDDLHPHALRATAATHLAYRGLGTIPLTSMMGWSSLSVAEKYVRRSGSATSQALSALD